MVNEEQRCVKHPLQVKNTVQEGCSGVIPGAGAEAYVFVQVKRREG